MGNTLSNAADAVPKKMMEQQRAMMLKQRELQMAVTVAQARDNLMWISAAASLVALGGTVHMLKHKSMVGFAPLGPLSFSAAYTWDFAYGNKLQRVARNAGVILDEERHGGPESWGGLRFQPPANNMMIQKSEYEAIFATAANMQDAKDAGGN